MLLMSQVLEHWDQMIISFYQVLNWCRRPGRARRLSIVVKCAFHKIARFYFHECCFLKLPLAAKRQVLFTTQLRAWSIFDRSWSSDSELFCLYKPSSLHDAKNNFIKDEKEFSLSNAGANKKKSEAGTPACWWAHLTYPARNSTEILIYSPDT